MGIFFDIQFATVVYTFLALFVLPLFVFKPLLLIVLLITYRAFPVFFEFQIRLGSINVYLEDLILSLYTFIAGWMILQRLIDKKEIFDVPDEAKVIVRLVLLYILLHVFYSFAGLYQGISPQNVIRRFSQYSGCLYFFFPILFINNDSKYRRLLLFIVLIAVVYPFWQLYIAFSGGAWVTSSGTFRVAGAGMPIIICALFTLLIYNGKKITSYLSSIFPIFSVMLTGHRSMFLALAISLTFFLLWNKKITKSILFIYLGSFGLFFVLIAFEMFTGHDYIADVTIRAADTFNTENKTSLGRAAKIKDSLSAFMEKPIAGFGYNHEEVPTFFGGFPGKKTNLKRGLNEELYQKVTNVLAPHNFLMRVLGHMGIIGSFLIISIIGMILKRSFSLSRMDGINGKHGAFLFCTLTFFLVTALMNTTFVSEGEVFWILSGTSVLIYKKKNLEVNLHPQSGWRQEAPRRGCFR
jgi:O-antigen ligase